MRRPSTDDLPPPTVFISWAHRDRAWSPETTQLWEKTIVDFAYLLRRSGIDVEADIFHYTMRGVDWTRYGPAAIARADTVLMVSSDAYWERWQGRNPPDEGAGVVREADALHGLFNADQAAFQRKALIVVLPGGTDQAIPHELHRVACYQIPALTENGIESLLRLLLDKPKYPKSDLRTPPELPAYQPDQKSALKRPDGGFGLPPARADLLARHRSRREGRTDRG